MTGKTGIEALVEFLDANPRLLVLTGAGISTGSGIPGYRDEDGAWQRPPPVQYRDFIGRTATRQRYWARSMVGWPRFNAARPNICHEILGAWETSGMISTLVTQNVDRLHQAAGAHRVIDLHGRLDRVGCLACGHRVSRESVQAELLDRNPAFAAISADTAPDGDACLTDLDFSGFDVPACTRCGGMLKPDVVFFGETIPRARVETAVAALRKADALLVIGSSLMVYSGYRFCRLAHERGQPIAAITPGRTRADDLVDLKLSARFEAVIEELAARGHAPGAAQAAQP